MKSDEQIMAELAHAVEGLWYMSESDYPIEPVRIDGKGKPDASFLCELAKADDHALVETRDVDEFFRDGAAVYMAKGASGTTPQPANFEGVVNTLKRNLSDIRVYRIGEINILVYVLGKSGSGSWLGVRTRVVET